MPGVAEFVAAKATAFIVSTFNVSSLAAAKAIYTTAYIVTSVAIAAAPTLLSRRPDAPSFEDPGLQLQPQRGGTIPRTIVYGETLTAGHIVYINSTGTDNKFLDMVIAIGDAGPYESIEAVYFDEEELTLDGSGNVTSPSKYNGFATIITTLGSESQSAISEAVSNISDWTSNHAGKGVCHAYVRLTYDPEVWTQGLPTVRFKVRGRKVYDPRLDSTNGGTGTHRKDDATTWEFSQNKALWLLDWLRGVDMNSQRVAGFDVPDTLIDWGAFADAADVCDDDVDVDGGGTIKRYTGGGGTVSSADDPKSVADMFIRCMAGEWAPRSGYIGVYAGASRTAAVTLTDDDLAGSLKLRTAKSIRETVNRLQATYRDPAESYEMTDAPAYINASWESDDGEVLESEVTLPFIDDHRQAQRICKLLAGRVREPRELTATFKQKAMQVLEGDAFTWSSERFPASVEGKYIVTNRVILSDGTVQLTARSETTGFYTWDETTEEATRTVTNVIGPVNPVFGLDVLSPSDYRRTLLADLPTPTLRLDFVDSDYDANLGGALTYKDTASWNDDVDDRPVELTDGRVAAGLNVDGDVARAIPEPIKTSSDILSYTGGGTFTGDLTATFGADWANGEVANRPTELTDGRISTALDASGILQTNIAGEQVASGTVAAARIDSLPASQITSGTFADARIASTNVTQHEASLSLAGGQITSGTVAAARIDNLPASQITSGTFADALIASTNVTQHEASLTLSGGQIASGTVAAARIDNLPASQITTGTFADARIAASNVTQHEGSINALSLTNAPADAGATAGADFTLNVDNIPTELTDGSALLTRLPTATLLFDFTTKSYDLDADRDSLFDGRIDTALNASGVLQTNIANESQIPSLSTAKITSGTFADARIASSNVTQHEASLSLGGSQITSGTVAAARIDSLPASQITSGTFADARIASSNVTQHQGDINALSLTNAPADAGATAGADWDTDLDNVPTELTDGRVTSAIDSAGDLQNDIKIIQRSGTTTKRSVGRALSIIEAQDGDAITFASSFDVPPKIRILGGTGATYNEEIGYSTTSGGTVRHLQDYAAKNVTTAGFDVSAKIRGEVGTTTSQSDNVATAGGGSDPDFVGDKATADEAFDDNYRFAGTLTGTFTADTVTTAEIGLYTNDGTGWVQRATVSYFQPGGTGSISYAFAETVNVDGLGQHGGDEFGISIESSTNITSPSISGGVVTYESIASVTDYTATPGNEVVFCYVFESEESLE